MIKVFRNYIFCMTCMAMAASIRSAEPVISPFALLDQDALISLILSASTPVEAGNTARSLQRSKKGFADFLRAKNETIIRAIAQKFELPTFVAAWYLGTAHALGWADTQSNKEVASMSRDDQKKAFHRVLMFFNNSTQEHEIIRRLIALGTYSPLDPETVAIKAQTAIRGTTKFDLGPVNGVEFAPITINELNALLKIVDSFTHQDTVIYVGFAAQLDPFGESAADVWRRNTKLVIIIFNMNTRTRQVYTIPLSSVASPSRSERC